MTELSIKPDEIRAALDSFVSSYEPSANAREEVGTVTLAADGIAYVPFFPLGGFSPVQSDELNAVADDLGTTPMAVALAWLLQRSPNILLIPGTSSVQHLHDNIAAASLTLPADAVTRLDAIGA